MNRVNVVPKVSETLEIEIQDPLFQALSFTLVQVMQKKRLEFCNARVALTTMTAINDSGNKISLFAFENAIIAILTLRLEVWVARKLEATRAHG